MDPGTAVGVVSLAIQVCEGLLSYYRDWKDFDADTRETYTAIGELRKTFNILDDKLKTTSDTLFVKRAKECLLACHGGVEQLDKKLKKVHKESPSGTLQKIHAMSLRSLYPFRKSTLEKLDNIVRNLTNQLGFALQVTVLDNTDVTRETTGQIKHTVDGISDLAIRIQTSAQETKAHVSTTAIYLQQSERDELFKWLAAPDCSVEHDIARAKHEPGTGEWLLNSTYYHNWISGEPSRLWLHGKAGCCKTTLCSTVVDDVKRRLAGQDTAMFAYFYFTFADPAKQSYRSLLLSMVDEISRKHTINASLLALYNERKPRAPSVKALEHVLIALLQQAKISYLVVDALEECSEDHREEIVQGLMNITQACSDTRILIFSRLEADIEDLMESWGGGGACNQSSGR